ncbi:phosphatase PAP2 family protein [Corynebacterium aquatimens]|uniref:phosphatase PAP2 family protein n=1 Tax=Corynebacterium TaxID=1716 RepID=UPI001F2B99AF|nr:MULTISPECIES: phosphatase PAP2 family protein [Corynebacterium]QYH19117.1 phosphatase PAP2 family protein [Corynebacterium aquatimens]UIZ92020.1 phosphatase PAP2 family protein [Corynebacterium sp. CNCTC7651]
MSSKEADLLVELQEVAYSPAVAKVARGLSHFGEHDLGWMAVAAAGAAVDEKRRRKWIALGVGTFTAHAVSVVLKRIVRRPRPHDARITIGVKTPSKLSFPSSHATNTGAAAVHLADITGSKWPFALVPVMMLSRNVLGVHYPTDTLAGAALGAAVAQGVIKAERRI